MAEALNTTNANDILISNKGVLKINGIELAELSELEIKMNAETKTIGILNSPTRGEIVTAYTGDIKMKIHKVYSRFKPELLKCAQGLQPYNFNLEATIYTPKRDQQESIYIDNCWFKGDINLMTLKADADFVDEEYTMGFQVETAEFTDVIDDGGINWESL